jgi:hypothetical protein
LQLTKKKQEQLTRGVAIVVAEADVGDPGNVDDGIAVTIRVVLISLGSTSAIHRHSQLAGIPPLSPDSHDIASVRVKHAWPAALAIDNSTTNNAADAPVIFFSSFAEQNAVFLF